MKILLLVIGSAVFIILFLSVLIILYISQGSLSGLLSEKSNDKIRMHRFQFLVISLITPGVYLLLVLAQGKFLQVPDYLHAFVGLSSMGYLSGKGFNTYKIKKDKN